jgi:hypothetical protein
MSLAAEIRQVANDCGSDRPDIVRRLLHIAVHADRLERMMDETVADDAQRERIENPPRRLPFKLRLVP